MNQVELLTVKLSDIEFGDRIREDYGDLSELAGSIKARGLIQPLAVMRQESDKFSYLLLAGGRRFRAMQEADISDCPIRIYPSDLPELEIKSIELAENLHRKDFDWTEQVKLQREIHDLQQAIYGKKISTAPDADGWSMADTAKLVGKSTTSVSDDIQLANAIDAAPELFDGCKNKSEAAKVLKSAKESIILDELSRRASQSKSITSSARATLINCYINKDFFEGIKAVPSSSINFIELDPPYAIQLAKIKRGGNTDGYNEIGKLDYPEFMQRTLEEAYRVMADNSWMIVWFAPEPWFESIYHWITDAGFTTNRMCGIWVKNSGQSMHPETNLANAYEMFFICRKGKPALVSQGRLNVFNFSPVASQNKIHPTERPIELIQEILSTFCLPKSRILVPFLGSGATLIAAHNLDLVGIGYEINKEYKDRYILKLHKEIDL